MPATSLTAPAVAQSATGDRRRPLADAPASGGAVSAIEVPAAIAGTVNLVAFSGALAQVGIVGRYDADRGILVIEPVRAREPAVATEGVQSPHQVRAHSFGVAP
ncbi:MAG: hypothetical protein ACYCT1_08545 [Steroidobacteraceae bacterium]